MNRILFVHNGLASFVSGDRDILRQSWAVEEWPQYSRRVRIAATVGAIRRSDLVFGWFASWHTFWPITLARLLRKPSLLVVGGYDVASLPEIGYGHARGGLKKWISGTAIRQATAITTISHFSKAEIQRNLGIRTERIGVIYPGISDPWSRIPDRKDALALSVGNLDKSNLERKGHSTFVRAAAFLPDIQFVLVGRWLDESAQHLRATAPSNVTLTGHLPLDELRSYFVRASIYVQPSRHEGFGVAVAEAMLAGCVPVVSRVGALPEVVGETGLYLNAANPEEIATTIERGLEFKQNARQRVRDRVLTNFSVERRRAALTALVSGVMANSRLDQAH
jgi:glycosyltransferase involved in cell wall biosynthesis